MSSSALRIIAILLALGAAVMGYLGYQASQQPVETGQTETEPETAPEPTRYPVVIASRDIAPGEIIEADDLATYKVLRQPDNSFVDKQSLTGREAELPIYKDDMLLTQHFHEPSTLVKNIRAGERAVAVRVDEVTGSGGFIQPGDRVDVLLYLQSGQEMGDDSSAQRLLSNIRVLAYGDDVETTNAQRVREQARAYLKEERDREQNLAEQLRDEQAETADAEAAEDEVSGKKSKTAVLAVNKAATSALLLAESTGRLRLALLGDDEPHQSDNSEQSADEKDTVEHHFVVLETFNREPEAVPKPARDNTTTPSPPPRKKQIMINRGANESSVTLE